MGQRGGRVPIVPSTRPTTRATTAAAASAAHRTKNHITRTMVPPERTNRVSVPAEVQLACGSLGRQCPAVARATASSGSSVNESRSTSPGEIVPPGTAVVRSHSTRPPQ